jgi:predicted membrane-bound dolichyl-phosphate-mannose-protein mannosyltransferase
MRQALTSPLANAVHPWENETGEPHMIGLLIAVIVLGVICYIIQILPIAQPFKTIAWLLVALIFIVWLLESFGTLGLGHFGGCGRLG